jgi:MinD-like ATPase involved in chromosome partitioning or flagellar assembly
LYTITFYSFKGGVGRTLALVNVGAQLARMGRKVLLVDFDLEAPGLETFELLRAPRPHPQGHPGMVEYVTEYMRTKCVPDIADFTYSAGQIGEKDGRLWVMPAGRRNQGSYQSALAKIDWQALYRDSDGFLLFEDTKAQWEKVFNPDYVLIDSRTGHTDVEGICTRQLPDAVVALFFPNEQNLVGLKDVCRRIRAEAQSGLKKEIELHFVASNVPDLDDEDQALDQRLKTYREELGFAELNAVVHHYESALLFNQAVFVLEKPRSRLAKEYCKLAEALVRKNMADREVALERLHDYSQLYLPEIARDPLENEDYFRLQMQRFLMDGRISDITRRFWDDPSVMAKVAECRMLEGSFGSALRVFNWVLSRKVDFAPALLQRALCSNRLGKTSEAAGDLLRYLQLPGIHPMDVIRGLRELNAISPNTIPEAIKLSSVNDLHLEWKQKVAEILGTEPNSLAHAIEYLYGVVADLDINTRTVEGLYGLLARYLMQSGRWQEATTVIEKAIRTAADDSDVDINFWLGYLIASWGASGILSEDLCRWWLNYAQCEEAGPWQAPLLNQVNALASWRLGDLTRAQEEIETAIKWMDRHGEDAFSCWRNRMASPPEFLEDCHQIQRLIEGEPVQPAFLSEPAPPVEMARAT